MTLFLSLIPLGLVTYFIHNLLFISQQPTHISLPWVPGLGINASFYLDGLSLLMAILISGIGFFIVLYAGSYLRNHPQLGRFYFYLLSFMASMLGVVTADNMIVLFMFWELTSITSYFLIGFNHEHPEAQANALQALLVTGAGGLCLLGGFVFLGQIIGSYQIAEAIAQGPAIMEHPLGGPALIMILIGAFTKSAQFPFHFWLPNAMVAPAPVSAYLHSSTMVKAGIYLLARFFPLFNQTALWQTILPAIGLLTIFTGIRMSLREQDMKKQLATMTVTSLGIIVLLLGIGSSFAIQAAMTFLLAHALYKGALFMVVGAVDHQTHCRDAEKLGGLAHNMPLTAAAALIAGLSMAGAPPFFGFIAKEMTLNLVLESSVVLFFGLAVSLAGMAFVLYSLEIAVKPFFGPVSKISAHAHEAPWGLWLGALMLGLCGLVLGVFPHLAVPLLEKAVLSITPDSQSFKLELWHGVNKAFIGSVLVFIAGIVLYKNIKQARAFIQKFDASLCLGPESLYARLLAGLIFIAKTQTKVLQTGQLRWYMKITILALVTLSGFALYRCGWMPVQIGAFGFLESALCILAIVTSIAAASAQGRLTSVAYLGVVGLSVTLLFITYGAPDLAMTQFVVDMLSVILLALVLHRIPTLRYASRQLSLSLDLLISIAAGVIMFLFVLFTTSKDNVMSATSQYFAHNSLMAAHGRNIVNVILVDFRALDTLGEITVLIVAGLGSYSLIKMFFPAKKDPA